MRAVSVKRAKQNRAYLKLRATFFEANPECQYPTGCGMAATEVHHKRGRIGALLLAVEHWAALCAPHHRHVTEHPAEAYTLGISERRAS